MNTVRVDLSVDQLKQALRRLPSEDKVAIWRMLDSEIDRSDITRHFDAAIKSIRSQYGNVSEEEVMADALHAVRQTRKAKDAKNRP